jgi:hypothetical protein
VFGTLGVSGDEGVSWFSSALPAKCQGQSTSFGVGCVLRGLSTSHHKEKNVARFYALKFISIVCEKLNIKHV